MQLSCEAVDDDHDLHVWKCNQSFQFGGLLKNLERVSRTQHDNFFVGSWDTCTPVKRFSYLWMGVTILLISELVVLLLYISFQPWRYTPKHGGVSPVGTGDRHTRRLH